MDKKNWRERHWHPERFYPKDDGPVVDFGLSPMQDLYDWREGLRHFYQENHNLIEKYPAGCQIVKNAELVEKMLLSVFGEILEEIVHG